LTDITIVTKVKIEIAIIIKILVDKVSAHAPQVYFLLIEYGDPLVP